jgi:thiol-disulfide isomerase/thioredoxin
VSMAYCDLFPDGRMVPNDSFGFRLDPSPLFPRLPVDAEQAKDGWQATDARQGTRTEFTRSGATGTDRKEWVFDGVRHSPMDKIYLSTSRARYVFDGERGLVKRVESRSTQGYGFNGEGTGTIELTAVDEQDAGRVEAFAKEADRYFEANREYQSLLAKASKDAEGVNALLSRAEATLKDARESLMLPVLREQVDAQLKDHERMTSYYTEEAKNRAAVLGKDAAEWETKDLEGETHSMKGYRGKVVVLDFWYRGCGWCIRAMPQVKELADDFRGEPVAVLGMNTDRKEEDAKFVVEAMGLNYPTLKAEGLPEKFHVRGFPTLIIIDQEGKVADVHVGYSPTLREEVSKTVRGLLDAK